MRKNTSPVEGTVGLVYQCRLPLSSATLDLVASLVRDHLKKIRSRRRKLPPGRIAPIVLAVPSATISGFLTWQAATTSPRPPLAAGCWK